MSLKLHPRQTKEFIGHYEEKKIFEKSYFNKTLQHCWLLEGPAGIGKTTFAYCAARAILSFNNLEQDKLSLFDNDMSIEDNKTLNFNYDDNNLIHHRIRENTHPDMKIVEQTSDENNIALKEIIPVDKVREIELFFSKTSVEGGWRIAIIDSLDNLNKHGSNALLKILEEPPKKCLIFLISGNKSNVLDTIRSRSRVLKFRELDVNDTTSIINKSATIQTDEELKKIIILANGSPGKAITLYNNNGLDIYDKLIDIFLKVSDLDITKIEPLLKSISIKQNLFGIKIVNILITIYLNRTFKRGLNILEDQVSNDEKNSQDLFLKHFNIRDIPSLWELIYSQTNLTNNFNLDKKQAIINLIENILKFKKNDVSKGNI